MNEQTVAMGSITNAIVNALHNRDTVLADFPRRDELTGLQDSAFYPLSIYLDLCDFLEDRLGVYAFLRVGRRMARVVMDAAFPPTLKTVAEAIAELHMAHVLFCKPVIGAIAVVDPTPGRLAVRYTAPYNCTLQEGLFYEVALRYGADGATVSHAECRRKGLDACRFEIRYSPA